MTASAEPGSTWDEVLDGARRGANAELNEARLTAILAAALGLSPDSLHERRDGDFPPGVPAKATVRNAARILLELTEEPRFVRSRARRSLAWTQLLRLPQHEVITDAAPQGEVLQAAENCRHALAELRDAGDPTDGAIVVMQFARFLRRSNRSAQALDVLTRYPVMADDDEAAATPPPLLLRDAPFLEVFLLRKVAYKHAEILYNANKDLGLLEDSMRQVEVARSHAHRYAQTAPIDFVQTWNLEGDLHRRKRDVSAMLRMEEESNRLATVYSASPGVQRLAMAQISANASVLQDFSRAQELRFQRLQARLFEELAVEVDTHPSVEQLMDCVDHYRRLNSKVGITWLGNVAFDLASGYVRAGDTASDPQIRLYAEGLLNVAEASWDGFATNGINSLLYARARLALMSGDAPTEELTAALLVANRNAYRSGTATGALKAAVRHGLPGSVAVRKRLDELLADTDPETSYVAYAKTLGLSAEWCWRAASFADVHWKRIDTEALAAIKMLRHDGVSIDPESEAVAWMAAGRALDATTPMEQSEQLRRILRGIGCVTELMLTIATTVDRQRMASKFHILFTQAADLAIALQDHDAADLIMEAARRDRVGLLLSELARNPDIGTKVRAAALAIQDSGSATVDSIQTIPDEEEPHGDNETGTRGRSAIIAFDRALAVKAAETVLGPLSALADVGFLADANAKAVLQRRGPNHRTTAVIQLLPLPMDDEISSGSWISMLRRCTIAVPGRPAQQHTDRIVIPRLYLDLQPGTDDTFEYREPYTPLLFPQPLIDLLASTPVTEPIRLMIVPTGFFHIPFDALPVTADTHVLDHALVSVHGSLTSALSLIALEDQSTPTPALAVYDHTLIYARSELDALLDALQGVRSIESLQDLNGEMTIVGTQPHSLLAMAVHGSADNHGWGQAKKLRDSDGNTVWVTAAQALSWTVPRLCVLASCNTPIATPDGVEIGGFPLALMLRGATTVIGGQYDINDKATSDIMIIFWKHLAAGESALAALRHAKLDYLRCHPNIRHNWPEHWAGLTVYGAANT